MCICRRDVRTDTTVFVMVCGTVIPCTRLERVIAHEKNVVLPANEKAALFRGWSAGLIKFNCFYNASCNISCIL